MSDSGNAGGGRDVAATFVVAADDSRRRRAIRRALDTHGFRWVGDASTAAATRLLVERVRPLVCLVDSGIPGGVLGLVSGVARRAPATAVVVLGDASTPDEALSVLSRGAFGYLDRDVRPHELVAAIDGVRRGEPAVPRALVPLLVDQVRRTARRQVLLSTGPVFLTEREWDVAVLLRDGRTTAEIAEQLGVSPVTIRRHISLVMRKLAAPTRAAATEVLRLHLS